jgi:hypothetical protein
MVSRRVLLFFFTRGMVMFSSNDRCCFRRLGIERGSTEQQIKQAYRQLARESHPDMFNKRTEKERATVAFRALHETYQEALTANSRGSGSDSDSGDQYHGAAREQNRNARTATDSDIRKAFQDICDELDRVREDKQRERDSLLTRSIQEAWPDRDLTWQIAKGLFMMEVDELVESFEGGPYDDISSFLREKVALKRLKSNNKYELEFDQWARYIEDHWPDANANADTTRLKKWALKKWALTKWTLVDYKHVADRVRGKIPLVATSIMDWEAERMRNINKRSTEKLQQSANDIIRVYPDRKAIATIVKRHILCEREELFDLLPETMRLALQGLHRSGELEGLYLELEEPLALQGLHRAGELEGLHLELEEPNLCGWFRWLWLRVSEILASLLK